jgi:hypothetical protein
MKTSILGGVLAGALLATPAFAQSSAGAWSDVPDRFQIDAGYFNISANTVLRYNAGPGLAGDVDFEKDLGLNQDASTFWVDGTWRVGRRHQVKLAFTRLNRNRDAFSLQRDFTWGGEVYSAGLEANAETGAGILAGYYRFAIVRNERFEIGPAIGIGYLSLTARIRATGSVGGVSRALDQSASTGSVTGAIGGYASGWLTKRLVAHGDFLYLKASPGDSTASITDWRLGADYYFLRNAGLGVQYKYDRYSYDRGLLVSRLGGEITYEGFQVFASFRF